MTQEFWGPSRGWDERGDAGRVERRPVLDSSPDDTTGAIRAIREGVTAFRPQRLDRRDPSGSIRRTRVHGTGPNSSSIPVTPAPDATLGELAGGRARHQDRRTEQVASHDRFDWDFDNDVRNDFDDEGDVTSFHDDIPLTPTSPVIGRFGLGAVDPLLARLGALVVIGVLMAPVALALRPSNSAAETIQSETPATEPTIAGAPTSDNADVLDTSAPESNGAAAGAPVAATDGSSVDSSAVASSTGSSAAIAGSGTTAGSGGTASTNEQAGEVTVDAAAAPEAEVEIAPKALDEAATVDVEAERMTADCSTTYTATSGDSWYAIASAADVSPGALMSQNSATTDTVILPGDEICLPPGASISKPATTAAPTSTGTNAPTTNAATTSATPTTAPVAKVTVTTATATTKPSTTTASSGPASVEQVKQMIRETWPQDQHEMAFFIADRESRFDPRADNNFCCYGVFQIYFEVHKSWLDDFGVYTPSDLFDAKKNIAAAYRIYERSGGWGPWGY